MPRRRFDPLTEIRVRPGVGWDILFDRIQLNTVERGLLPRQASSLRSMVVREVKKLLLYGPEFGLYVPGRR